MLSGSFCPFGGFLKEFLAPFGACTKVLLAGLRGLSASHTVHTPEVPIPLSRPSSLQEICSFQQGKGRKRHEQAPESSCTARASSHELCGLGMAWQCHGLTHPKGFFCVCAPPNCSKSIPQHVWIPQTRCAPSNPSNLSLNKNL